VLNEVKYFFTAAACTNATENFVPPFLCSRRKYFTTSFCIGDWIYVDK